jgi:hypothetical protein
MLLDGKEVKVFKLSDLNSRISFSKWIIENIELERGTSESDLFKKNKYLEYLNYIESQMMKQPLKNKTEWIARIKQLKEEWEKKSK